MVVQTLGIFSGPDDNRSLGHQPTNLLVLGHGPTTWSHDNIPSPDDTMAMCASTGPPDCHSLKGSMALKHQHGFGCAQPPGIHVAFDGTMGHGQQHRTHLW